MIILGKEKIEAQRKRRAAQDQLANKPAVADVDVATLRLKMRQKVSPPAALRISPFVSDHYRDKTPLERLQVLRDYAYTLRKPLDLKSIKSRRRSFSNVKKRLFPLDGAICWVCFAPAIHRHHVIQIQNGGAATSVKNLVYLCEDCHCAIHPWMTKSLPAPTAARFALEKAKLDAGRVLEDAALGRATLEDTEGKMFDLCRSIFNSLRG